MDEQIRDRPVIAGMPAGADTAAVRSRSGSMRHVAVSRAVAAAAISLAVVAAGVVCAAAEDKPVSTGLPSRVETRHTIELAGRTVEYRAMAETIGLTDRKGEPTASVYTVSYLADGSATKRRPVAFVFNGGPGAASVFLHLGAAGPRILDTPANGAAPSPPVRLAD